MRTSEGVTVDFCPANGGILFDLGEVAAFFELATDLPAVTRAGAKKTGLTWENPKTPGATMVEVEFPALDGLRLDICEKTGAIWFDKGEVQRFEALTARLESPRSRFARVFADLRKSGYQVIGVADNG